MLVKLVQAYGFLIGAYVPDCHKNGPFSWNNPSRDEQPGPPFSQIAISSDARGFSEGKNQNHSRLKLAGFESMDKVPA